MDRAVDAAAAEQRPIGRIHDRVERQRSDVGNADIEPCRADLSGNKRRHVRHDPTYDEHYARIAPMSRPFGARFGGQVDGAFHADIVEMVIQKPPGGALAVDMQRLKEIVVGQQLAGGIEIGAETGRTQCDEH